MTDHHRFLLRVHLQQVEALEGLLADLDARITEMLRAFRDAVERLTTVPGISATVASVLVAEIGVDMQRFPSVGHLVSWVGLCPRMDEGAGKRR